MLAFFRYIHFSSREIVWHFRTFQYFPPTTTYSCLSTFVDASTAVINPSVPATKREFLERLLYQQPKTPPNARVLKIAVIGPPNVGKSSLVNMLIGWRVCAVAGKAHTTRSKQMAALMQDNVQIVFVDLPGLLAGRKRLNYNLGKSFIRDPHAAIFDADLIMVVADVSRHHTCRTLHPEVVKALHYFEDKESILVLNKIDKLRNDPTRLLEITRKLTRGIVSGRRSHKDAYENRFLERAKLPPNHLAIKPPSEIIAEYLPDICHEEANKLLAHLAQLRLELEHTVVSDPSIRLVTSSVDEVPRLESHTMPDDETSESEEDCPPSLDSAEANVTPSDRLVTPCELQTIDDYFIDYKPSPSEHVTEVSDEVSDLSHPLTTTPTESEMTNEVDVYYDSLLHTLKEQLLMKTATSEQVEARRKRWLQVSLDVKGVTDWTGFREVFMVSSATGEGMDRLRNYLTSRAVPGRLWMLSPLLVTDHEPGELVRMCVWAHCLQRYPKEIPYALRIVVDDCERARLTDDGDDRVFVHARIQCKSERQLRQVLGVNGSLIREIAGAVKTDLMTMFRSNTVVKLTAEMAHVDPRVMRKLRRSKDFAEVFPELDRSHS